MVGVGGGKAESTPVPRVTRDKTGTGHDRMLVLNTTMEDKKDKGDFLLEVPQLIECVVKLSQARKRLTILGTTESILNVSATIAETFEADDVMFFLFFFGYVNWEGKYIEIHIPSDNVMSSLSRAHSG
jgi:hypothetical protein